MENITAAGGADSQFVISFVKTSSKSQRSHSGTDEDVHLLGYDVMCIWARVSTFRRVAQVKRTFWLPEISSLLALPICRYLDNSLHGVMSQKTNVFWKY